LRYSEKLADLSSRVHLFVADGLHLAFDVNSGSLYDLDEVAWELVLHYLECGDWEKSHLNTARKFGAQEAADAFAELQELVASGLFFSSGEEWLDYVPGKDLGLKALCLNIAHECNLACKYCFVPENVRAQEKIMSRETIKAALDLLLRETPYQYLTVDFFGGEPLLNFEGIKFAVEYALDQGADKKRDKATKTFTLKKGDSLSIINEAFEGITVQAISKSTVEFSNSIQKSTGEELDVDIFMTSYQEQMMRLALECHFETEKTNFCGRNFKIKTLALFFIDDIN
jgi:bifunctional DNA-binding transcriptional regulator/antitoxin component of YhaV-PrlF toxin-antitoxin module